MKINYFLWWLPMIALAFGNATIRQLLLVKYFDELRANQLSTLTLTIFCALYIWIVYPRIGIYSATQALWVGFLWMLFTLLFEFSLGLALKKPVPELLQQYNVFTGNFWPFFLIVLLFLPYLIFLFRK